MASPICQFVICITCEIPGLFGDVIRCNPKVQTIFYKKILMKTKWEEVTVTRFVMTHQGDIISWDELPKTLTKRASLPRGEDRVG